MTFPIISPTGAMASGDYVTYMIGYVGEYIDAFEDELSDNVGNQTIDAWDKRWGEVLTKIESKITELNEDIADISRKVLIAKNKV